MIFFFENNGFGEGTGHDYAVGCGDITARAAAFGMPAERVDGRDFFAVYDAVNAAVARARAGEGPQAVEAVAKRFHGHFVGDPMNYRTTEERSRTMQEDDPLKIFRRKVTDAGLLSDEQLDAIDKDALELIESAVRSASDAPWPQQADLETDVYIAYA
jgi:TPP-dependent pyruvate/acetoin dehydrogenase alpha subunit